MGGVFETERNEKARAKKFIEGLAAHNLDDAGGRVDAGLAVAPSGAGLVLHGSREPIRYEIGESASVAGACGRGFAEAGDVGEDLEQREIGGLARGGFKRGKTGNIVRDRVREFKFTFVLQHEHGGGGHELGHGHDVEHRVRRHGTLRGDVSETMRFKMENFFAGNHQRDRASDFFFIQSRLQSRGDAGKSRIGGG